LAERFSRSETGPSELESSRSEYPFNPRGAATTRASRSSRKTTGQGPQLDKDYRRLFGHSAGCCAAEGAVGRCIEEPAEVARAPAIALERRERWRECSEDQNNRAMRQAAEASIGRQHAAELHFVWASGRSGGEDDLAGRRVAAQGAESPPPGSASFLLASRESSAAVANAKKRFTTIAVFSI